MTYTARHIHLSVTQQVGLENLLAEPQGPKGAEKQLNREQATILNRVRRKVRLSNAQKKDLETRKVIIKQGPNIGIDEDLVEGEKPLKVYLETDEVRKLHEWGEQLQHPNMVAVLDWLEPVMEQLEAKVSANSGLSVAPAPGVEREEATG